jgi:hypothetical protein
MDVRIEKEGNEWIAVIPPPPDMPDEELGLPASSREEAEAEGRAWQAITQSSLYKFDFDESKGVYAVSIGKNGDKHEAVLLADAYKQAQEAYSKRVSEPPPPDAAPPAPEPKPKQRRTRSNGTKQPEPDGVEARRQATQAAAEAGHIPPEMAPNQEVLPPQQNNITSGIGNKPTQLQPDALAHNRNRIDRLEMILVAFARTIIKEIKDGA